MPMQSYSTETSAPRLLTLQYPGRLLFRRCDENQLENWQSTES